MAKYNVPDFAKILHVHIFYMPLQDSHNIFLIAICKNAASTNMQIFAVLQKTVPCRVHFLAYTYIYI